MRLSEIQKNFRELMLDDFSATDHSEECLPQVFEAGVKMLVDRLRVYRGNIIGNTADALLQNFPLLEKLTGRDFVMQMAQRFVLQNPPQKACLNSYCHGFDAFVENYEGARGLDYLPDMARL